MKVLISICITPGRTKTNLKEALGKVLAVDIETLFFQPFVCFDGIKIGCVVLEGYLGVE
jgi:hypothetical protein